MSKQRKVALVVVVLLGAATVLILSTPSGLRFYRSLAYERKLMSPGWSAGNRPIPTMHYLEKRVAWLPGYRFIVPDQVCDYCQVAVHSHCRNAQWEVRSQEFKEGFDTIRQLPTLWRTPRGVPMPADSHEIPHHRCTCNDERHR